MASTGNGFYGRGLRATDIKSALYGADNYREGNYWSTASKNLLGSYDESNRLLERDYSNALMEAYSSKIKQQGSISSSGIVGAAKGELLENTELAYQQAYEAYKNNLAKNKQNVLESYVKQSEELNKLMTERSQMFSKYSEKYYDYLQFLYDEYYADAEANKDNIWNNPLFRSKYLTPNYDEEGNVIDYSLRSKEDLYNPIYEENPETGEKEYYSLYDEEGNLTSFGIDYFDQLENYMQRDVKTFGNWLYETDEELYNWAYTPGENIYDWSSYDGTNAGTFRELVGRESSDRLYSFAERASGLTTGQIKGIYSDVSTKFEELSNLNFKDNGKQFLTESKGIIDEIEKLSKDLGIQSDMETIMGMSWDSARDSIDDALKYVKDSGEMAGDWFKNFGGFLGVGAAAPGASMAAAVHGGATIAGAAASVPWIGWAILGVMAVGGIVSASIATDEQRKLNEQLSKSIQYNFNNMLRNMVDYSVAKRSGATADTFKSTDYIKISKKKEEQERIEQEKRNRVPMTVNLL